MGLSAPLPSVTLRGATLFFFLFIFSGFAANSLLAQAGGPGNAWNLGVAFGTAAPDKEDAWVFDAVEMDNGDLVVVGYVSYNYTGILGAAKKVPGYAVMDAQGNLKAAVALPFNGEDGIFSQVAKSPDGTYVVMCGRQGTKAILLRLSNTYVQEWVKRFDVNNDPAFVGAWDRLLSVNVLAAAPPETLDRIVLTGFYQEQVINGVTFSDGETFILSMKEDGSYNQATDLTSLTGGKGRITDSKIVQHNGQSYLVFTGYEAMGDEHWSFEVVDNILSPDDSKNSDSKSMDQPNYAFPVRDRDVVVGIYPLSNLSAGSRYYFNSNTYEHNTFVHPPLDPPYTNPHPPLFQPPACATAYGPCTPGLSKDNWGYDGEIPSMTSGSPVIDKYLKKISWDEGRSISYSGGFLYVAAEFNTFLMSPGIYKQLHHNQGDESGVRLKNQCNGEAKQFTDYKDAYIHLFKLNMNGFVIEKKNVAHFSGGDFAAAIVVDQTDGNIVLGGTTADKGICGLPPLDVCTSEVNLLMKFDPNLNMVWQQHFLSYGKGNCAFNLIQTADGGFVLVGNNEFSSGDETFNIIKYTGDCAWKTPFDKGDLTMPPGTTTWDANSMPPVCRANGLIRVPSGATLIIDGITLEFAYSKYLPSGAKCGITVEPGGKLTVRNNAILKGLGSCGQEIMWDGVIIQGNPAAPPGSQQGAFNLLTGGKILNAVRGAVSGDAGWTNYTAKPIGVGTQATGTTTYPNYEVSGAMGGGKITVVGGFFTDCAKSMVWAPYPNHSNLSQINNAKFECTGPLKDLGYRRSKTALGEPIYAENFCEMRSVYGIAFNRPQFANTGANYLNPRNKPSGILSMDAQFRLTGSTELTGKDLYIGVEADGVAAGAPAAISVDGASFEACYQSINLRNTTGSTVTNSTVTAIPPTSATPEKDGDASGIWSDHSDALAVTYNTLTSGGSDNYGLVVHNSGGGGANIQGNTFNNFPLVSNQFELDNLQLSTRCNVYNGLGETHWRVFDKLANQGIGPLSSQQQPDNQFYTECATDPSNPQPPFNMLDIQNAGDVFTYFEKPPLAPNLPWIVMCTENVNVVWSLPNNSGRNCLSVPPPCLDPPCAAFYAQYVGDGKTLPQRNDLLTAYTRWDTRSLMDSTALTGINYSVSLLADRDQQVDRRALLATYTALGQYGDAQQRLNQVTGNDAETQDLLTYYGVLVNAGIAGRDIWHLNSSEQNQAFALAAHDTYAGGLAQALQHYYQGEYVPLVAKRLPVGNRSSSSSPLLAEQIKVFPNPFSQGITFEAGQSALIWQVVVRDATGKVVFEAVESSSGVPQVVWQPRNIPAGMYFYEAVDAQGKVYHGKLTRFQD